MTKIFAILSLNKKWFILLLALVSLLKCAIIFFPVRLIMPPSRMFECMPDSTIYDTIAKNLILRRGFSLSHSPPFTPTMFKEPIYALFIAATYYLFGPSVNYVILLQVFLNSMIAIFTYLIGTEVFDEKISRHAAILVSVIPIFGEISFYIETESFCIPLILLFTLVMIKTFKRDLVYLYALSGAVLGIISLCRNALYYFFPAIIILIFLGYGKGLYFNSGISFKARFLKSVIFLFSFLLVIAPWTIRNIKQMKSYQISERGGRMLWTQAVMSEELTPRELKSYFLYLISGHLAQRYNPQFIGNDFGNFEYRYFDRAPSERLARYGYTEGQIDLILAREAVSKIISHPFRFIVFSTISYLQIFKYFVPWSLLMNNGEPGILSRIVYPAIRFIFGFPLGIIFTTGAIVGIYFSYRQIYRYLPIFLIIAYFHFLLYFTSSLPGAIQRFILPIVPLYSFFICICVHKILALKKERTSIINKVSWRPNYT